MLRKRRLRAKDKLSVTEEITLDETADRATADEWRALAGINFGGFEWKLREAERIWRRHAPLDVAPEEHSLGWYARQILFRIDAARAALASQSLEQLALNALEIGLLHEAGRWRQVARHLNQRARTVRAKNLRAGRTRGRDAHASAREHDEKVIDLARRVRLRHPRDTEHSTRWLADQIGRHLHQPASTVRKRLTRLGIT